MGVEDGASGMAEARRLVDCGEGWFAPPEIDDTMLVATEIMDVLRDD